MKQSRRMSLAESVINIAIGLFINLVAQIYVFALFGIYVPLSTNLSIAAIFTVISIVRSYTLRRLFEIIRIRGFQ